MTESTCERCGEQFAPRDGKRFCSELCRRRAEHSRRQERKRDAARLARSKERAARPCLGCGSTEGLDWWVGRMAHPGAASSRCETCYLGYLRERYRTNPNRRNRPKSTEQRARQIQRYHDAVPSRVCPGCGGEHRHGNGQRCADCAHDHRKSLRSTAEARRLDAVRAGDQDIHWTLLGERDGWVCHICSKRVPKVAGTAKQPMGATVDHLIPIAHGGEHVWANVALAHRNCNISRGARGVAQLRLVG